MRQLGAFEQQLLRRAGIWLIVIGLTLLAAYGVCQLAWKLALQVSPDAARLWALLATAALPITAWAAWRLALRYAAGFVTGISLGVNEVAKAGKDAADLRGRAYGGLSRSPDSPVAILPEVQIVPRQLTSSDVIDL